MKKTIFLTLALMLPLFLLAQNGKYEQAMGNALQKMGQAQSIEAMQTAANEFGRIAQVKTDDWLPFYYQSLCHMQMAMMAMGQDPSKLEFILEGAQTSLDKALEIAPQESELYTLQGYIYIGHIWKNPMVNGATYSPLSLEALGKAIELDPTNPRPFYLQAMNIFHTPEPFGGGSQAALPIFQQADKLFAGFEQASPFHPTWGQEDNTRMLEACLDQQ